MRIQASRRLEPILSALAENKAQSCTSPTHGATDNRPTILFLQSHPSWFGRRLARALEGKGCRVLRVNFCMGDAVYWLGRPALHFRGTLATWPTYLQALIEREHVTDVLYYGDGRPYHRAAADVAANAGINAYVYEFGYLRPDWITLERGGMSGRSHFPIDPEHIRAIGAQFPMPDLKARTRYSMRQELAHEITYNLLTYVFHLAYPRYVADRYYNPVIEYLTGIPHQIRAPAKRRQADAITADLLGNERAYYLMPLQLQCDYQLRNHAHFAHQNDAIREVLTSFAANAPHEAVLVLKCHPLDNGGENWPQHTKDIASKAGLTGRVHYIEGGDLPTLLKHAKGTVTINSTVGVHALIIGCPVKTLGTALFDVDGLTHQSSLDTFWLAPEQPDKTLVEAFVRALAGTIQVKGDFFTAAGQASAIATVAERLMSGTINGGGAFVDPPPRLHTGKGHSGGPNLNAIAR